MNTKRQRVEIHWHDIFTDSSWVEDARVIKADPIDVISIGYIMNEDGDRIVLSHSMIERADEKSSDYTVIPRGCIQSMWKLKRNGTYTKCS